MGRLAPHSGYVFWIHVCCLSPSPFVDSGSNDCFVRSDVLVFGTEPGVGSSPVPGSAVGYMPQDIALYQGAVDSLAQQCVPIVWV